MRQIARFPLFLDRPEKLRQVAFTRLPANRLPVCGIDVLAQRAIWGETLVFVDAFSFAHVTHERLHRDRDENDRSGYRLLIKRSRDILRDDLGGLEGFSVVVTVAEARNQVVESGYLGRLRQACASGAIKIPRDFEQTRNAVRFLLAFRSPHFSF